MATSIATATASNGVPMTVQSVGFDAMGNSSSPFAPAGIEENEELKCQVHILKQLLGEMVRDRAAEVPSAHM
jgi:hypothetical protein